MQKNGIKFEASVRKREKDNPLFGFLHPGNQHHVLYRSANFQSPILDWSRQKIRQTDGKELESLIL